MALSTFRRRIATGGNLASFSDRQWSYLSLWAVKVRASLNFQYYSSILLFSSQLESLFDWQEVLVICRQCPVSDGTLNTNALLLGKGNIFQPRFHAIFLICINPNDAVRGHRYWRWRGDASIVCIGLYWIFNTNQYGNLEFNTLTLYWLVLVCICLYLSVFVCIFIYYMYVLVCIAFSIRVCIRLYWNLNTNQYGNLEFNTLTLYWLVLVCICLSVFVCIQYLNSVLSLYWRHQYRLIHTYNR